MMPMIHRLRGKGVFMPIDPISTAARTDTARGCYVMFRNPYKGVAELNTPDGAPIMLRKLVAEHKLPKLRNIDARQMRIFKKAVLR